MSLYNYTRRPASVVRIGKVLIGGDNPVCVQSMTNTNTNDIKASADQIKRIADAGGEIVRLTTQGVREASALADIRNRFAETGCDVPLSADVHFNPKAAFRAAETAEKVRINPGNFVDAARTFQKLEFTDEEYAAEIRRISDTLIPFLEVCRKNGTAVRLGVNHGSLSDRIMSRYGDTPEGMVESVMEFLRVCREVDFNDVVISIKASNTVVMHRTVRLLVEKMDKENMHYPLHLGVTEAGDAEDGRTKSAVGIGALLAEGIGDTIRVSLSEPPENEIPVALFLRDYIGRRAGHPHINEPLPAGKTDIDATLCRRRQAPTAFHADNLQLKDFQTRNADVDVRAAIDVETPVLVSSTHINPVGEIASFIDTYAQLGGNRPVMIRLQYDGDTSSDTRLKASADAGALLLNGYGDGICIENSSMSAEELAQLELDILQATRLRISKTEYIACPGCGRTLFDLQTMLAEVKQATSQFKGLKIGVMGCIVNGPGEMADADYGLVGAGHGRVSLYKGKELVIKNIPQEEGLTALVNLILSENP